MDLVKESGDGKPQPEQQPQEEVNALQSRVDLEGDVFFDAVEDEHLRGGGPASLADCDVEAEDVADNDEDKEETGALKNNNNLCFVNQKFVLCFGMHTHNFQKLAVI